MAQKRPKLDLDSKFERIWRKRDRTHFGFVVGESLLV
jgi:hypothetical protein